MVKEIGKAGITAKCLERLRKLSCAVVKIHGGPYQPNAVDILGAAPCGHALAIETKKPGDGPTPRQGGFLRLWASKGAITGAAHSADEAEAILKGHHCELG